MSGDFSSPAERSQVVEGVSSIVQTVGALCTSRMSIYHAQPGGYKRGQRLLFANPKPRVPQCVFLDGYFAILLISLIAGYGYKP